MSKAFASQADLEAKQITFTQLSENAWAYTAEGDPNSGVVIGDDGVLIVDTTATPAMAQDLIARIRTITDKPIKYVVLSHYHAVRVLGASAYFAEGAQQIIASRGTYEMIVERGEADMRSEIERFPRLFAGVETVPGLTWPTLVFDKEITLFLGQLEVRIAHLGSGHTKGDTVVWLPQQKVLFSGDLVEYDAACYCGDAQLAEWPATLDALQALNPEKLVPGRGPALTTPDEVKQGIAYTKDFVTTLFQSGQEAVAEKLDLKAAMAHTRRAMDPKFGHVFIYEHCLPFDVSRAYDEASGMRHPRIWTAQRDKEMWAALQD
ncbi:putative Metallo-hydrolase/oxidoreductase, Beta-lactamase [Cupriavidus taiwanensis]|uniref:Metallo-hydrolase/oxidoreductase, Beta-lactamase n=1 Tax=Cupriavidus taiwanensis TaxID=164546 RepID=A0A375EBD6_9BURK|nr:MBL fold metallo-hydrolase [Cupriavidus taiwanensis]SOZ64744.1 putative Metallo-hydrolase/oxidoreductase, Beta-lactamase [Cupriavidus taiwanensis]SOZ65659.1 putative Metallo-hydrolase/oxidoreductase, Beta-lactamase [Cupriavidus taiwanensis]SOZ69342.1 putative Metallo-hydrolase/oxidoreductase, Beta-lactamase [Cupriavidus taiwanensis]SPA01727.1 putative Metallo-hydrolase/oxidoreductase, Beta-lactamase [Cupriavidus taiwanensis]SPA08488.1 putative Metallo-hydrolase/oxidoreductase, Beta-lactamas